MSASVDAVVLTNTASQEFHEMTRTTLDTLRGACGEIKLNLFVVESNPAASESGLMYEGCNTLTPNSKFNYNLFMQMGLELGDSEHVLMCNNDLIFEPGSVSLLISQMAVHGLESASPYEPNWHVRYYGKHPPDDPVLGYEIENHVCGWCICARRDMLGRVGPLDERFSFWCQDSNYSKTLQREGVRHALVPRSMVRHEFSRSHGLLGERHHEMTHGQKTTMLEKWGQL
jgi:GT2 family glycosyltransferase